MTSTTAALVLLAAAAQLRAGCEDRLRALVPPPREIRCAGEDRIKPASARAVFSEGVPAAARSMLKARLPAAGARYQIHVLDLSREPARAAYRKLTGEAPPPSRYGQGYSLDLRRSDRAVIAGDGPLGVSYGVRQFLDLLPGGLDRAFLRDYPDFETRLVHQQGFDKGYGAGDRWSLADFEHDVPRYLEAVSAARFTALCLNLEAGWVNQLQDDAVLARIIERARAGMTDIVVSLEYAGMPDRKAAEELFRRVRLFELNGAASRAAASSVRKPLCGPEGRNHYLKAARRVLALKPGGVMISFDDFPAACDAGDLRFNGKELGAIATAVVEARDELSPATRISILPRFYGEPHWKSHPRALPDLLETSPREVSVVVTSAPEFPYLAAQRQRFGERFLYWVNLTSNHMKEKKSWFPTAELQAPAKPDSVRGQPGAAVILNLGTPVTPQTLTVTMSGSWLWNRQGFDSAKALAAAARPYGPEAVRLLGDYGAHVTWPVIEGSLGWNIIPRLDAAPVAEWERHAASAARALEAARRLAALKDPQTRALGESLVLTGERLVADYRIALLLGRRAPKAEVEAELEKLKAFLLRYPVIANDAKDAEVVARGFRSLREYVAGPARYRRGKFDDEIR